MLKTGEKAQAAMEYLMTIGFGLLILLGLTLFAYNYTLSARQSAIVSTASATVNNIVESANLVHTQGYPAKATLVVQIPENVETISFSDNTLSMRVFVGKRKTDVSATAKVKLVGNLSATRGFYKVSVRSFGNYVNVTRT